mgnify:CR=1 FL=1
MPPTLRPLCRSVLKALPLALLSWISPNLISGSAAAADQPSGAGAKGAQVYCFMRNNGTSHEVSWMAAYALIKRQSSSPFKTSPEHAAVMITEAVVQNPGSYPDCGKYLGDLYERAATQQTPAPDTGAPSSQAETKATPQQPASGTSRYAY